MEVKEGVLAVSFGTTAEQARREEIGGVEAALRRRCPERSFARAYTSPTIRTILARRGTAVPSLEEALEAQLAAGAERLYVLPTHLLPGYEYDAIAAATERFRPRFQDLRLAPPLMGDTDMVRALAKVLMDRWPKEPGRAVVLVGHGTAHPGNLVYSALQGIFDLAGREDFLVGTIEGWPGVSEVRATLSRRMAERVLLVPLLLTAGVHAREDIAGPGPESWKSRLEAAGLSVEAALEGLGGVPEVQALYVRRLEQILEK